MIKEEMGAQKNAGKVVRRVRLQMVASITPTQPARVGPPSSPVHSVNNKQEPSKRLQQSATPTIAGRRKHQSEEWNRSATGLVGEWCLLCNVPHQNWLVHTNGNREHQCLNFIYSCLISHRRSWLSPEAVYRSMGLIGPDTVVSITGPLLLSETARRHRLFHILRHFHDLHIFTGIKNSESYVTSKSEGNISFVKGENTARYLIARCMFLAFPGAHCGELTAFMSQIWHAQHVESVFDTLGMREIVGEEDANSAYKKTFIYKTVMGDLADVCGPRPSVVRRACSMQLAPDDIALARYAMWGVAAETLLSRMGQYVALVEKAWQRMGWECSLEPVPLSGCGGVNVRDMASRALFTDVFHRPTREEEKGEERFRVGGTEK